jgi:predicted phage baseplate assembly protein
MPLTLPNLDDRRWSDLVEEARSLIPVYGPEWTDHNVHDPGITLVELFAWIAETDIYRLNQVPERHRRKFLWLLGMVPSGPRPALTTLSLELKPGTTAFVLPAAAELDGQSLSGERVRFRTPRAVSLVPGRLAAVQSGDGARFTDLAVRLQRGEAVALFGEHAGLQSAFYLGFDQQAPPDTTVTVMFSVDPAASAGERLRLLEELRHRAKACRPPASLTSCETPESPAGACN